ncbi:MAG: hypothetical protein M0038_05985 [Pseudomonadota bacterium]|nr:hypothetical protein [Pseudomonadota bacterium]
MSGVPNSNRWRRTVRHAPRRRLPGWAGWLALLAFGLRALVPLGFEPGTHSLAIQLCHEGFPSGYFAHGRAPHGAPAGRTSTHCTFCNGTTPAPAYALAGLTLRATDAVALAEPAVASNFSVPLAYTPQARAPPIRV